jgi:hypothetical protein
MEREVWPILAQRLTSLSRTTRIGRFTHCTARILRA